MMAQPSSSSRARVVGDYIVGRQIGSGSFSVVWHARHRALGTEVAIKEIVMERLSKKLQESLLSEIDILQKIDHPSIIRLHNIIKSPGRILLVLEYCRGGDLSIFIQRHGGRVPEATAKHFMQQLAAGLQILRENNLIHRDLKPQNLLLSTNDNHSVLKIADFGFARSLQPRGLAETLCGSPLYMAPEIMQFQKYDAKADLWSVGAILFQLVTGKTPFTGNNQMQLLQNILKSNELRFPQDNTDLSSDCLDLCRKLLRRNPVERLTFEEFFNHPFLSLNRPKDSLRYRIASNTGDCFPLAECDTGRHGEESSQEDCLPFPLEEDSSGPDVSPSFLVNGASMRSNSGFSGDAKVDKMAVASNVSNKMDKLQNTGFRPDQQIHLGGNLKEPLPVMDQRLVKASPKAEVSASSISASRSRHSQYKSESSPVASVNNNITSSVPMPIIGAAVRNTSGFGSLDSHSSAPSGTSQGSMDIGDAMEQPSSHCLTRIRSLQQCASSVTELVKEKIEASRQLEAFSIQLVILAIWKQALHICHTEAASAVEGSPTQDSTRVRGSTNKKHSSLDIQERVDIADTEGPEAVCSQIEKKFLHAVGHAEELARHLEPNDWATEMPDAMETIFQSALAFGRHGAVEELMGDMESAASLYSKAVRLLNFLLVEAQSLILNPPFSLTSSDRFRLRMYIDILNNRQGQSRSQRIALFK
ncbi:serine/threonine-protein kinase ATG1c-like isoform X2 [Macadamia integrifolia]|uniref:serine/threonine-protein kinase ATG1c-like isoform X2 n=1 Tax=Macadamia integrifolia TaxID=60698 RepID=UPI001C4EC062|nr:serine/threonine-protein kinase ATG1c-like isoform X2 [Macadamia integrifolia]